MLSPAGLFGGRRRECDRERLLVLPDWNTLVTPMGLDQQVKSWASRGVVDAIKHIFGSLEF